MNREAGQWKSLPWASLGQPQLNIVVISPSVLGSGRCMPRVPNKCPLVEGPQVFILLWQSIELAELIIVHSANIRSEVHMISLAFHYEEVVLPQRGVGGKANPTVWRSKGCGENCS